MSLPNELMVVATIVIALATVVNLIVARAMWSEMHTQGTILRQQLVGSQGAVIRVSDPPGWDPLAYNLGLPVSNDGAGNGTVNLKAKIVRRSLPDQGIAGDPVEINIVDRVVPAKLTIMENRVLPWQLEPVDDRDWPGKFTLTISGSFDYNNGFGDKFTGQFCFFWLPKWTIQTKNGSQGGGGGFYGGGGASQCDVQRYIDDVLKSKKQANEAIQ
jgi:hypothetical protein